MKSNTVPPRIEKQLNKLTNKQNNKSKEKHNLILFSEDWMKSVELKKLTDLSCGGHNLFIYYTTEQPCIPSMHSDFVDVKKKSAITRSISYGNDTSLTMIRTLTWE